MSQWFYSENGKDFGPLSTAKIADAVMSGKLELFSYVLSSRDNKWVKVQDVPEIMDVIHKPAPHPIFDDVAAAQFSQFIQSGTPWEETEAVYYNISARKMLWMQLITFGLFEIYWFFRQWWYYSSHSKRVRLPFFLAQFLFVFFAYKIFKEIENDKDLNKAMRAPWSARTLALIWYLGIPVVLFLIPTLNYSIIPAFISTLLAITLTSLVLYPIQCYINAANEKLKRPVSQPSFGLYAFIALSCSILIISLVLIARFQM